MIKTTHIMHNDLVKTGVKSASIGVFSQLISLATSIFLAKQLGVHGYGVYVYALAIMTLLTMISQLGVSKWVTREVGISHEQSNLRYLYAIISNTTKKITLFSTFVALSSLSILWFVFDQLPMDQMNALLWLFLLIPIAALRSIITATLFGLQYIITVQVIASLISPTLLLVALSLLFWLLPETRFPEYATLIHLLNGIIILFITFWFLWRYLPSGFWRDNKNNDDIRLFSRIWPFTLATGIDFINSQTDIIMLGVFQSVDEVSIYRIAAYGSVLTVFGLQIIRSIIAPKVASLYVQKQIERLQKLIRISTQLATVSAVISALILLFFGERLIILALSEQFLPAYTPLIILMVGTVFSVMAGPVVLLANMTGYEKTALRFLALAAVLNVILNAIFIPIWSTTGAAVATSISIIFRSIMLSYVMETKLGIKSHAFSR